MGVKCAILSIILKTGAVTPVQNNGQTAVLVTKLNVSIV